LGKSDGIWRNYIHEEEFKKHYEYAFNLMNMMVAFKEKID